MNLDTFTQHLIAPPLSRDSVLQCFKHRNTIEIHSRIMVDFYPGVPQFCVHTHTHVKVTSAIFGRLSCMPVVFVVCDYVCTTRVKLIQLCSLQTEN